MHNDVLVVEAGVRRSSLGVVGGCTRSGALVLEAVVVGGSGAVFEIVVRFNFALDAFETTLSFGPSLV